MISTRFSTPLRRRHSSLQLLLKEMAPARPTKGKSLLANAHLKCGTILFTHDTRLQRTRKGRVFGGANTALKPMWMLAELETQELTLSSITAVKFRHRMRSALKDINIPLIWPNFALSRTRQIISVEGLMSEMKAMTEDVKEASLIQLFWSSCTLLGSQLAEWLSKWWRGKNSERRY